MDAIERAHRAYQRGARPGEVLDQPTANGDLVSYRGRSYVVLSNSYRTLAVYRIRGDGRLRRLRRWPKAVAD
jgi:hypothetical protein